MANFGFAHLSVVAPYGPHWREARSAVGAPELLQHAKESGTLADAVSGCTLVVGTGTIAHRKPEQKVVPLPGLAPLVKQELDRGGRVALVFGPEKHGLTRQDLSWCNLLVEIPTDPRQPSMNLGQAVAVCLYELASRVFAAQSATSAPTAARAPEPVHAPDSNASNPNAPDPSASDPGPERLLSASSGSLDRLAGVIAEAILAAGYSPSSMLAANRHDLRLLLRRLAPTERDTRRILGLFRRILWRLKQSPKRN
jgi:tRNA/rRNA methyltransferase